MQRVALGPFNGESNKLPDYSLVVRDVGTFVRAAVDVDITNGGTFRGRRGRTQVHAMIGAHSGVTMANRTLFVRASNLYEITSFAPYSETLLTSLTSNATMSYAEHNGTIYFSNGTDIGRLVAAGVEPVGLASPPSPSVSVIGGSMAPGWYQVALSYTNASGEESGITPSTNVELGDNKALHITLPGGTLGATHINIYVSPPNSENPQFLVSVPVGTVFCTVSAPGTGRLASSDFLQPMPAGKLAIDNGRLVSYKDKTLTYSEPYNFGLTDPKKNYILFENNIEIVVPAQGGRYVADGRTRWFGGADINKVESVIDVVPYGAVPGTAFELPQHEGSPLIGWMGAKGILFGDINGGVRSMQEDRNAVTTATAGFSFIDEHEGVRSVVVKLSGVQTTSPSAPVGYDISEPSYVMNLATNATTRYSASFNANSAFKRDGVTYLLNAAGLCTLGGDTDEGAAIDSYVDFGKLAFGSDLLKRLSNAYVGAASNSELSLRVYSTGVSYDYEARGYDEELSKQRFDLGRGMKSTWFGARLMGNGAQFEAADISFLVAHSTRRI